jgi:nucleotide-binding universal stress UspA family protein
MSDIRVIPAEYLIISSELESTRHSIRKMEAVLTKQGQIEPLQVKLYVKRPSDGVEIFCTYHQDTHAADIVMAARNLGWPTLLVSVQTGRYEY